MNQTRLPFSTKKTLKQIIRVLNVLPEDTILDSISLMADDSVLDFRLSHSSFPNRTKEIIGMIIEKNNKGNNIEGGKIHIYLYDDNMKATVFVEK